MWAKVYAVEVKMEVVWVDVVFMGTLALLTKQRSAEIPVMLLRRHSEGAQSSGYIQVLFPFYREDIFTLPSSIHECNYITHFSHKRILIQVFRDNKYLPHGPLKKHRSASL